MNPGLQVIVVFITCLVGFHLGFIIECLLRKERIKITANIFLIGFSLSSIATVLVFLFRTLGN
jgi:hypothetical protein